jgi:hypothetical protein
MARVKAQRVQAYTQDKGEPVLGWRVSFFFGGTNLAAEICMP